MPAVLLYLLKIGAIDPTCGTGPVIGLAKGFGSQEAPRQAQCWDGNSDEIIFTINDINGVAGL